MPVNQFKNLARLVTQSVNEISLPPKIKFDQSIKVLSESASMEAKPFYSNVHKLCQLEGLDVLCFNCDFTSSVIRPNVTPSKEVLSVIF